MRDIRQFLALTFALSWGLGGGYLAARTLAPGLAPLGPTNPLFLLINCAPSLSAFALVARRPGGAAALLAQLWRPFAPLWLLIALLFVPAVCAVAGGIGPVPLSALPVLFLDIAPWGEEFGWRGYALPRLRDRMAVLPAALLVGAVWIIWHIPAFFLSGVMAAGNFLWWALGTMALSLVMGVLQRRANANLLVAGIIPHLAINAAARAGFWHSSPTEVLLLAVFALGLWGLCARRAA
jgi:membrane protease YdiL (CAAX protease family)